MLLWLIRLVLMGAFFGGVLLFQSQNVAPSANLRANRSIPLIDQIIRSYAEAFDNNLQNAVPYKNHCYRVYNLAVNAIPRKLSERELELLAIATGFHDLGVFTHKTLDYLGPSEEEAAKWMKANGYTRDNELETVKLMIEYHHKLSEFKYDSSLSSEANANSKTTEEMVERLRRGDWIDVTFGVRSFGMDPGEIKTLREPFPQAGFALTLIKAGLSWVPFNLLNPLPFVRF